MKNSIMTPEQKAKKAAYNKAYAAKKKSEMAQPKFDDFLSELKFEKEFAHKVRLYKNLKIDPFQTSNPSKTLIEHPTFKIFMPKHSPDSALQNHTLKHHIAITLAQKNRNSKKNNKTMTQLKTLPLL